MTKVSFTALIVLMAVFVSIIWGVAKIATDGAVPQGNTYLMPAEFMQAIEFNATQPAFLCAIAFLLLQALLLFVDKENQRATLGVLFLGLITSLGVFLSDKNIQKELVLSGSTLTVIFLGVLSCIVYAESGKNALSMVRTLSFFCTGAMIFVAYRLLFFV